MNLILILFISSAYCLNVPKIIYDGDSVDNIQPNFIPYEININSEDTFPPSIITSNKNINRIKRKADLVKNTDDTYTFNSQKDLINDGSKKLTSFGNINGIKPGDGYDSINAGLDFTNVKGSHLGLVGLHSKTENKLTGEGLLNILDTDTHSLTAKGFGEKSWRNYDTQTKYGGSLDYLNKNGHDAFLSAQHDSNLGDHISAHGKYILFNNDEHNLNAKGYWNRDMPINNSPIENYGGSLNYLNLRKGHSASVLAQHIPDLGDQLSLSGKYNLFHNDDHDLHASGQFTRTFPSNPYFKNYNEYSGNLDYLYKDKFGLDLGMKHSDLSQRTDYSAMGNLNLFRDTNSHLDVFGGLSKSVSPSFNSPLIPSVGIKFEKSF